MDGERERPLGLAFWLAIAAALVIRGAVVMAFPGMDLHGDEQHFVHGAQQVLAGEEVKYFPFRPPLYIYFCAAVLGLSGVDQLDAIRWVQVGLEGLAILGLALLLRRTVGTRVATVAAWLWALYPDYIAYSHYLWSETLALCITVFAVLVLVLMAERPTPLRGVLCGLLFGGLALVKPYAIYLLPPLLAWLVFLAARGERGRMLVASGLTILVALATVTPWSVAVSRDRGRPIFICTTGARNLVVGVNYVEPPQTDFAARAGSTKAQRNDPTRQRQVGVLAFILQNPGLFLERAVLKMSYLWSPNSFLLRNIYQGGKGGKRPKYGRPRAMPAVARLGASYGTVAANILLTLGLIVGLHLGRHRLLNGICAIWCLGYMGMITLTPSLSRYRLPLMIFAIICTACVMAGSADWQRLRRSRPVAAGLAVSVVAMVALWGMHVPRLLRQIF